MTGGLQEKMVRYIWTEHFFFFFFYKSLTANTQGVRNGKEGRRAMVSEDEILRELRQRKRGGGTGRSAQEVVSGAVSHQLQVRAMRQVTRMRLTMQPGPAGRFLRRSFWFHFEPHKTGSAEKVDCIC